MNSPTRPNTVPFAELLEQRQLLAATIVDNVLVGTGTSGNDVISIRRVLTDDVVLTINGVDKTEFVKTSGDAKITMKGKAKKFGLVNGANFVDVASLSGYGTIGQDLVHVHFGNATHDLLV